jgi:hypothetical protein
MCVRTRFVLNDRIKYRSRPKQAVNRSVNVVQSQTMLTFIVYFTALYQAESVERDERITTYTTKMKRLWLASFRVFPRHSPRRAEKYRQKCQFYSWCSGRDLNHILLVSSQKRWPNLFWCFWSFMKKTWYREIYHSCCEVHKDTISLRACRGCHVPWATSIIL